MSVLSVLGAIFLVFLALKFLPAILGILIATGVIVLVGFILAGIFTLLGPILILILVVAGIVWLLKKIL